ncbi:putative MFS multidrug transporter [Alternaria rosae]|uniref:putative MFS multidrug transporter n=1 Tax=Alternaria rosae TaxID=1187941 RepID=UPI001E8E48FC|nr:putative MFS multidrug transporter [Alternaria rosae]KAH6866787.1 putative MFS multidrug transporter [Alternaria rosae]
MVDDNSNRATGEITPSTVPIVSSISSNRLHVIIAGLWLCLFLSALDTTIVTTALIKISSDFGALEQAAWLITAYLLTYNSFLMITAKLSDIWGLRSLLLLCASIFLVFSMACGGAQTMTQLIVFRAFQGIGGSGLYSLTFVTIMKMIVPERIGFYSGIVSSVFALANLLGPLLGGVIADRTTWRWIFFMNGPIIGVAMAILFFSMPAFDDGRTNLQRIRHLDIYGGILSVCWPIPLIYALQEAGVSRSWGSGVIVGPLVAGIALLVLFGLYEFWISSKKQKASIFPVQFLRNAPMALTLLSQFLLGFAFYVVFVQLPQRFQGVNFTSAERAGILLLPATVVTPIGAMASGLAAKKAPVEIVLICSIAIVCVGIGLLSSLPTYSHLWPGLYGYEIVTGLALGLAKKDIAVGTGALNMVRTLGGCVAVAICSAIHREHLNTGLSDFLSRGEIREMQSLTSLTAHLPDAVRDRVGVVFGKSYNRQFQVMLAFTGLNIIVAVILAIVRKRSEAKIDQSGPASSGALAQDTCEKQAPEIAATHRPDDNAGACLGKQ